MILLFRRWDRDGPQRIEAVEADRTVRRRVGTSREDDDEISLFQALGGVIEFVRLLVHDVRGVARGARDDDLVPVRTIFMIIAGEVDGVANGFALRFR